MRTTSIKHLLLVGALATMLGAANGSVFAQESQVRGLSSGSLDGERTSYVVQCTNGTRGSVSIVHDESEYCAIAQGGKLRCEKDWTLEGATNHACKVGAQR